MKIMFVKIQNYHFGLVNTNKLLKYVDGVDGLKTGYTQEAGYCLTATANRNDMRVIAVVMGASKSDIRNQEITRLIEMHMNNMNWFQNLKIRERSQQGIIC